MAIEDLIQPYFPADIGEALTDYKLSDEVFTEKFWQQFPDGHVPIVDVPTLGVEWENPYEWATKVLARFDAARSVDLERLDDLSSQWHMLLLDEPGADGRLHDLTVELLGLGLSMRALGRYMRVKPELIALGITRRWQHVDAALKADDLLTECPDLSDREISRRAGYSPTSVGNLRRYRRCLASAS